MKAAAALPAILGTSLKLVDVLERLQQYVYLGRPSFVACYSTAHEVLGIYEGRVNARLGGGRGTLVTLVAGDVVVIPAGVAHKNDGASADFHVVGAYPVGTSPDMQHGKPGERPGTDRNIARVGMPAGAPVRGSSAIATLWKQK